MAMTDVKGNCWSVIIFEENKEGADPSALSRFSLALDEIRKKGVAYACVVHNHDKQSDGSPKPIHSHFVVWDKKQFRLSTLIRDIAPWGFRSINGKEVEIDAAIGIKKAVNKVALLRYLIHKDDPQKFQYDTKAVITNTPIIFENAISRPSSHDASTLFNLFEYANDCNDPVSYLRKCGDLDFCNRYARVISMVWFIVHNERI